MLLLLLLLLFLHHGRQMNDASPQRIFRRREFLDAKDAMRREDIGGRGGEVGEQDSGYQHLHVRLSLARESQ